MKRFATTVTVVLGSPPPPPVLGAQPSPIASGALQIQGNGLTHYADDLTDADQAITVGERARARREGCRA